MKRLALLRSPVIALIAGGILAWSAVGVWPDSRPLHVLAIGGTALAGMIGGLALPGTLLGRLGTAGAIARLLLLEARRSRISIVFLVGIAFLPAIGLTLEERLTPAHRLQVFLTYSLGALALGTGLLTVFLGTWSLSREVATRTAHGLRVSPISAIAHVGGKLLGLLVLDAVLLTAGGGVILAYSRLPGPSSSGTEPSSVDLEVLDVLNPHRIIRPAPPTDLDARIDRELALALEADPDLLVEAGRTEASERRLDLPGGTPEEGELRSRLEALGSSRLHRLLRDRLRREQRTIAPGESREFVLEGLDAHPAGWRLRYDVRTDQRDPGEGLPVQLTLGAFQAETRLRVGRPRLIRLPATSPGEDGKTVLTLRNLSTSGASLQLLPDRGLEVLSPRGSFTGNLLKALGLLWIRLAFLASLGLLAASCLSFPVASLSVMVSWLVLVVSPVLLETPGPASHAGHSHSETSHGHSHHHEHSHDHSHDHGDATDDHAHLHPGGDSPTRLWYPVASTLSRSLSLFAESSPVTRLAGGVHLETREVLRALGWIGACWSGVATVLAAWIWSRRELARVQV